MANRPEVNDSTAHTEEQQRTEKSGAHDQRKLDGRAFQVNENSVEEGDPIRPAHTFRPGDDPGNERLKGKSFQINKKSVEEGDSLHPDHSRPTGGRSR